uniref:Filamin A n=1 Tax=Leptobrachium leishanense TaxID=445787 RepID=A0A8C5WLR4_9ANUR
MSSAHQRLTQSGAAAAGAVPGADPADMPATEKDLAEDAPWKKIQQNTFTRWCNEHLKCVNKRIANLQADLSDGLRLIALLEVLSQKKMYRKYNQRPTFRQMQLENVSVALEFLDRENIKLVSIVQRTMTGTPANEDGC